MNDKFYVSLEAARLLNEKGYEIRRDYVYTPEGRIISLKMLSNWSDDYLPAPTKAEAIDWLESKWIYISIYYKIDRYDYILEYKHECCRIEVLGSGETRLEAEEAAIIKALELL